MARAKTRAEKIVSGYRLQNFRLAVAEKQQAKDRDEFSYLDASYVKKDLAKTVVVSILMIGIIIWAKSYWG